MKSFFFIFSISLLCCACNKPDFPTTPNIEFTSIEVERLKDPISILDTDSLDNIIVTIYFEDNEGDLGNDTDNDSIDDFNFWRTTYKRTSDSILFVYTDTSTFGPIFEGDFKIPVNGYIKHESALRSSGDKILVNKGDTLFFEIFIKDRAGNISNTITTTDVISQSGK